MKIHFVAGDTKLVERGKADGIYISTSGIGEILSPRPIRPQAARVGDLVLVNGDMLGTAWR